MMVILRQQVTMHQGKCITATSVPIASMGKACLPTSRVFLQDEDLRPSRKKLVWGGVMNKIPPPPHLSTWIGPKMNLNCDTDTPSSTIHSVTMTTQHAPACTMQALSPRLEGPDTSSYPLMLRNPRLRPGITVVTNTSAPFSRRKQTPTNFQI